MKKVSSEELKLIKKAAAEYHKNLDAKGFEENITSYMRATTDIAIPQSLKFIGLVAELTFKIRWDQICEINEYAIRHEDKTEGLYINWFVCAITKLEHGVSAECGEKIVTESLLISADALLKHPGHDGFAYLSGYFNYMCAKLYSRSSAQFESALLWLQQAERWQKEYYGNVDNRIIFYLGQTYLALNQWNSALSYFECVDEASLAREEGEEPASDLRKGILIAKAAISERLI